jgi:mono/diheme cytochrome c family protein
MDTTMTESVKHHAANIHPPTGINLRDPSTIERAAIPYNTVCKTCHGAPGVKRAEWVVMTPEPPDLQRTADSWSDGELYWIIKNGIKMTGMPAFGPSRSESDLWAMVAFVRNLPRMSAPQYSRLIQAASAEPPEAGDGHSR